MERHPDRLTAPRRPGRRPAGAGQRIEPRFVEPDPRRAARPRTPERQPDRPSPPPERPEAIEPDAIDRDRDIEDGSLHDSMRKQFLIGAALCCAVVLGFGGWAATAELAGAVIAPATVVVDGELKRVQHPTGGIVGEITAKDGDLVKAGDLLLKLDETTTRANLAIVTKQLDELIGRRARLESERDETASLVFPEAFLARLDSAPQVKRIVNSERAMFDARRATKTVQKAQLVERIARLRQEIEGLDTQKAAKEQQSALTENEFKAVEELYNKNLAVLSRFVDVQRNSARLRGEQGAIVSAIATARGNLAEAELQISQLEQTTRSEILKELGDVETKINELSERRIAGEDQLRRVEVRSPHGGFVHQSNVHTVGGVIGPGETLMMIVPQANGLNIDAKVAPQDIDQIAVGQSATVRLTAFSQRTTPELEAAVSRVAADITRDENKGSVHYLVRITLKEGEINRLKGLKLVPGMPADVYVKTGDRTAMSYLMKPLTDHFSRVFIEE